MISKEIHAHAQFIDLLAQRLCLAPNRGKNTKVMNRELPEPDSMEAKRELLRSMAEAALSLDEPALSIFILRFSIGMPSRKVAHALDLSLDLVKTRVRQGLKKLRDHLDHACHGDREKWRTVLAPYARKKLNR